MIMTFANLHLTDYHAEGRPTAADVTRFGTSLSPVLTQELEGAAMATGLTSEEVLLAALGRAIHRTIGDGVAGVDVVRHGRVQCLVALPCVGVDSMSATEMLAAVDSSLGSVSAQRTIRSVSPGSSNELASDVLFAFGSSTPSPARLGHFLELHAHLVGAELQFDWWYDVRSFEPYTVAELAEQFPYAMIELTSEATGPILATPELVAAY